MAMENKRIIQLSTERTNLTSGDYVMVDSDADGSAKYRLDRLKETDNTLSVSGMAADAAATGQAISDEADARSDADTALGNDIDDLKSAICENTDNLFDISELPSKTNITNENGVLSGTASAFNSAFNMSTSGISAGIEFDDNIVYTISFDAKNDTHEVSTNGLALIIRYTDGTDNSLSVSNSAANYQHIIVGTNPAKTVAKIGFTYVSQGAYVWHVKNLQIEKASAPTEFIPAKTAKDYIAREMASRVRPPKFFTAIFPKISVLRKTIQDLKMSLLKRKSSPNVWHNTRRCGAERGSNPTSRS